MAKAKTSAHKVVMTEGKREIIRDSVQYCSQFDVK